MTNIRLGRNYIERARGRLQFLRGMAQVGLHANAVRGSQEVVALALKGIARVAGLDPPREHDVGKFLLANRAALPACLAGRRPEISRMSRRLRREREIAFYGDEDFIPSEEYAAEDSEEAIASAEAVVAWVEDGTRELGVIGAGKR